MPKKCQELGCDTTVARADHGPLNWCEQHARERGFRLMQCPVCSRKDWIRGGVQRIVQCASGTVASL